MSAPTNAPVPPPDAAAPWVDVLGEADAIAVFLALGGSDINLSYRARSSMLADVVGADKAEALGRRIGAGVIRVPIPKPWICQVWSGHGVAVQEMARRLHCDTATVRRALKKTPGGRRRPRDDRQIELF